MLFSALRPPMLLGALRLVYYSSSRQRASLPAGGSITSDLDATNLGSPKKRVCHEKNLSDAADCAREMDNNKRFSESNVNTGIRNTCYFQLRGKCGMIMMIYLC